VQIALLEEGLHRVKMEFNRQFLALRDVKRTVCQRLQAKYARLSQFNKELGLEDKLVAPHMQQDEEPERRLEVTDEDIAEYLSRKAERKAMKSNKAEMTFGAVGTGAQNDGAAGKKKDGGAAVSRVAERRGGKLMETPEEAIARVAANTPLSVLEKAEKTICERRLV
jgi:hypothetical protein